jgi:hypothetical protein
MSKVRGEATTGELQRSILAVWPQRLSDVLASDRWIECP